MKEIPENALLDLYYKKQHIQFFNTRLLLFGLRPVLHLIRDPKTFIVQNVTIGPWKNALRHGTTLL